MLMFYDKDAELNFWLANLKVHQLKQRLKPSAFESGGTVTHIQVSSAEVITTNQLKLKTLNSYISKYN